MPTDVIMPALGMAQETGRVLRWLREEGDEVVKGDPLMEVETDKVTVEIEAPADGRLASVRAAPGADVPVGQPVAFILAPGESAPEAAPAGPGTNGAAGGAEPAAAEAATPAAPATRRRLASPKARRLAAEQGIELDSLGDGSGPHGALVAADIAAARAEPRPAAADDLPVSRIWSVMAERTTRSWQTAPHFYLEREVDASRLASWRDVAQRRLGRKISVTDLLVRASAAALTAHPRVNAAWDDGRIRPNGEVNVAIAVAVEEGLVVPVVHGADRLGLGEIADRRDDVVERARRGALRPEDVERATFTISNLGMFGVDSFSAVLSPPQAAILAVGRVVERVVAVNGAAVVGPRMTLTLSCDHRVVDGARAARFLGDLAALIEEPAALAD